METRYRTATLGKRFGAWLLDTTFLLLYTAVLVALFLWLHQVWMLAMALILFGLVKVYFWTMSTTLGKLVMGLKIVHRTATSDLSLLEMTTRQTLGKFISVMFLYVGIIWILVDQEQQGWHDKISDSIVVELIKNFN